MYATATYYRVAGNLLPAVLLLALVVRVLTQYLMNKFYDWSLPAGDVGNVYWTNVYYRGQAVFEFLVVLFALRMVKKYAPFYMFIIVNFFFGLTLFQLIKEYFLNPLKWQAGEELGFYLVIALTIFELVFRKDVLNKIINFFKLVFK